MQVLDDGHEKHEFICTNMAVKKHIEGQFQEIFSIRDLINNYTVISKNSLTSFEERR